MLPENVWIVIPAYNEEKNITSVIEGLKALTPNIVVVNDGSTDKTPEVCEASEVYVVDHLVNRGQGAALQTGNEFALNNGAEIIVHFDADGQHRAEDIEMVIKPLLENEADIVFGSRFLEKKSKVPWFKKYFILKPFYTFCFLKPTINNPLVNNHKSMYPLLYLLILRIFLNF